jgi:hypothetical protein
MKLDRERMFGLVVVVGAFFFLIITAFRLFGPVGLLGVAVSLLVSSLVFALWSRL